MQKIKILVVEDNSLIAINIAEVLKQHDFEVTNICRSGIDAIDKAEKDEPDLVLMDIRLSGEMDGIEAGKVIRNTQQIPIIFLSDFTDSKTVDRAKKILPANYLSKPFNEVDLIRAIELAFYNAKEQKKKYAGSNPDQYIFLKEGFKFIKVRYDDIIMLKAERAYCTLVTEDQTFTFSKSMNKIEDQLDHDKLYRVHRSFVINMDKITELTGNIIHLGQHRAELSKNHRDDFLARLRLIK